MNDVSLDGAFQYFSRLEMNTVQAMMLDMVRTKVGAFADVQSTASHAIRLALLNDEFHTEPVPVSGYPRREPRLCNERTRQLLHDNGSGIRRLEEIADR